MQAVIYARVSRDDGTQNVANQLEPLTEWAKRLGATVVAIEVDHASGKRGNARPGLDRVRQLTHERRFETLLIAALDRPLVAASRLPLSSCASWTSAAWLLNP